MSELLDVLDSLAARGWRLHQQFPGDRCPFGRPSPTNDRLDEVRALFLNGPVAIEGLPPEDEHR
jgi:hypothetical protein